MIAYIMYAMSASSGYEVGALLKIAGLKYDEGECINLDDCLADTGKTLMAMAYAFFSGFYDSSYIDFHTMRVLLVTSTPNSTDFITYFVSSAM